MQASANGGVSSEEAKYIRLDANGFIDAKYLSMGLTRIGSVGENYSSLMKLVNVKNTIEVYTSNSFETSQGKKTMGETSLESTFDVMYEIEGSIMGLSKKEYAKLNPSYSTDSEWTGWFGVTLYPDYGEDANGTTLNGNWQVIVNDHPLSVNSNEGAKKMTSTFAHEAYGHALFRILGLPHSHRRIKSRTSDSSENNKALENQIYDRENEANKNYDSQNK